MSKDKPIWDADAGKRLQQAPFFIRPLARAKVEKAARERGEQRITLALFEQIKNREMGPG